MELAEWLLNCHSSVVRIQSGAFFRMITFSELCFKYNESKSKLQFLHFKRLVLYYLLDEI